MFIAAFALRVYRLDTQSLWWDELFSIAIGQQPFPDWLLLVLDNRGNPPGIYFLEAGWTRIGVDAFTVRFLSVCFGVLAVALMYRVGKLFGGARAGLIASALMVVSPHHLWYSQEARMYAPQIFFSLAASYFFLCMLRHPTWRVTLGYALASVAVIYFHYHPFFLLAQIAFLVLFRRTYRGVLGYWLVGGGLVGLFYAPWFWAVFTTGGLERAPMGWVPAAQWYDPILTLYVFWLGATNDPSALINWASFVIALVIAGVGVVSARRETNQSAHARAKLVYLLLWLVLPILMVWSISLDLPIPQKRSAYVDRYLSPEFPAWIILVALGVTYAMKLSWQKMAIGAAIAAIPLVASLGNMYFDPFFARDNWKGAAEFVRAEGNSARQVLIVRETQQLPILYYGLGEMPMEVMRLAPGESESVWVDLLVQHNPEAQRFWLFSGTITSNVHRFGATPAHQSINARQDILKQLLDARLMIEREMLYQGIWVTAYRPPAGR